MKYLKYFEAAKTPSLNNFLKEVAERAAVTYQNILPQFQGDYINDWSKQEEFVKNIYNLINKEAEEIYPQFSNQPQINYSSVMQLLKPKLNKIIRSKMYDLYSDMMRIIYKTRYTHILPDQDTSSSQIGRGLDPKKKYYKRAARLVPNIYGKLEQIINNGWDNVISTKSPSKITKKDIADIVAQMDLVINDFEKTSEGILLMQEIKDEIRDNERRNAPTEYIHPSIVRQSLDYGSFETEGPWSLDNLFDLKNKLPKYQQTPPIIEEPLVPKFKLTPKTDYKPKI